MLEINGIGHKNKKFLNIIQERRMKFIFCKKEIVKKCKQDNEV